MKVPELKALLKELGMSQAGDMGTLEYRIAKGEKSVKLGLKTPDGDPVHLLKLSKIKPYAAKAGISPIGSLDEIMFSYMEFLEENMSNDTDSQAESSRNDGAKPKNGKPNAAKLSSKVLELAEVDDFIGILNLGGANLTKSSSVAVLRKAYLKLSLVLHPDKNKSCPDATKVFQALVNAYERISQPELVEEAKVTKGQKKAAKISRSNAGCKRTRVRCPRCKTSWSESSVEGNPEYFYNFLMTGIKSFNCATCLLEFGCMTALHECPFCRKSIEYHPNDYHRKITCGRKNCNREFGFYMYHCSERVLKNLKIDLKQLREDRIKVTEQKRRRLESFRRRRQGCEEVNEEANFLMGLANECPRCGMLLADLDDEDEISHLRDCKDEKKITENKRKKQNIEDSQAKKKQQQEMQDDVNAKATWDFLGASNDQLWMLTDGALKKECNEQGIDVKGKANHDMITSLVRNRKSQALTKYTAATGPAKPTSDSLPSNLHSMTVSQLRAIAASHDIKVGSKLRKDDIIELLQQGPNSTLMITAGSSTVKNSKASKNKTIYIDSDSDSESDFDPDE